MTWCSWPSSDVRRRFFPGGPPLAGLRIHGNLTKKRIHGIEQLAHALAPERCGKPAIELTDGVPTFIKRLSGEAGKRVDMCFLHCAGAQCATNVGTVASFFDNEFLQG